MDSFTLYRDRIGTSLTTRLVDAMEKDVLTLEESSEIGQAILDGVNRATNHQDLLNFVEELAHKWPLFGPVLVAEQSQKIEENIIQDEENAISQVTDLLKENKIDEAATMAEQATQESSLQSESIPQINQDGVISQQQTQAVDSSTDPSPTLEENTPPIIENQQANIEQTAGTVQGTPQPTPEAAQDQPLQQDYPQPTQGESNESNPNDQSAQDILQPIMETTEQQVQDQQHMPEQPEQLLQDTPVDDNSTDQSFTNGGTT